MDWISAIAATLLLASPLVVQGQEVYQIQVGEPLSVYASPRKDSPIVRILNPSQSVTSGPKARGGFYQVTVRLGRDRRIVGYIAADSMKKSAVKLGRVQPYGFTQKSRAWRVGGGLLASYLRQGKNTYQLSDGSVYDLTPFQSTSLAAGIFADYRYSETLGLRFAVHQRQARFVGEARLRNSMGPGSSNVLSTIRSHQFWSVSGLIQHYFHSQSPLWWGGGGELSLGRKISLTLNGNEASTSRSDLTHYGFFFAAMGVEAPLNKKFYWTPDIRAGAVFTTFPIVFYGEASLVLSYQL